MRVVVIGAGVLGASAAFHLARAGAEVVMVDRSHDGRATAAGAVPASPAAAGADLEKVFAARELGLGDVPLMCATEIGTESPPQGRVICPNWPNGWRKRASAISATAGWGRSRWIGTGRGWTASSDSRVCAPPRRRRRARCRA